MAGSSVCDYRNRVLGFLRTGTSFRLLPEWKFIPRISCVMEAQPPDFHITVENISPDPGFRYVHVVFRLSSLWGMNK
jgi:hypothetical protein